ncbi:hypothetical protein MMC29_000469 [Sticta canariensis]|nr:hypothetical protein [Sticta canariensis]
MRFPSIALLLPLLITSVVTSADSEVISDPFLPTSSESSDLGQEFTTDKNTLLASIFPSDVTNDCNYDAFLPTHKARARRSQWSNPPQATTPESATNSPIIAIVQGASTFQEMAGDGMMGENIMDKFSSDLFNPELDYSPNGEPFSSAKAVYSPRARLTADNQQVQAGHLKCINPYNPDWKILESIPFLPPESSAEICFRFAEKRWAVCDSGNPDDLIRQGITLKNSRGVFVVSEGRKPSLKCRYTDFFISINGCLKPRHRIYCCLYWYMTNVKDQVYAFSFPTVKILFDLTRLGV